MYKDYKCELVHILAPKTLVLSSGIKTGAPKVSALFFLRSLSFDFIK